MKVEVKEVDFNPEFVSRMIPKIDWPALRQAATDVSIYFVLSHHSNEYCIYYFKIGKRQLLCGVLQVRLISHLLRYT